MTDRIKTAWDALCECAVNGDLPTRESTSLLIDFCKAAKSFGHDVSYMDVQTRGGRIVVRGYSSTPSNPPRITTQPASIGD